MRLAMAMTMAVWRLSMPREEKNPAMGLASVPVVVMIKLQPQGGSLRWRREWR